MASIYSKKERLKYFAKLLLEKYSVCCHFCGTKLDGLTFYRNLSGKSMDDITVHHLDENRENNHSDNLVFSHRKCHLKFHRQKEETERKYLYMDIMKSVIETVNA
jgi:5-methylcytosine-specific restriction endonuclease McrA